MHANFSCCVQAWTQAAILSSAKELKLHNGQSACENSKTVIVAQVLTYKPTKYTVNVFRHVPSIMSFIVRFCLSSPVPLCTSTTYEPESLLLPLYIISSPLADFSYLARSTFKIFFLTYGLFSHIHDTVSLSVTLMPG